MDFVEFIQGYVRLLFTVAQWALAVWMGCKIGPRIANWILRK